MSQCGLGHEPCDACEQTINSYRNWKNGLLDELIAEKEWRKAISGRLTRCGRVATEARKWRTRMDEDGVACIDDLMDAIVALDDDEVSK